ncbi:MAG: FAD-binding oxidoreductase [Pseudomonadota bacterium]
MQNHQFDAVVIGAGIIGISTAYYLAKNHGISRVAIVDRGAPMAFTSAQSGENYRNWWPHGAMVDLSNRSIDLMEEIARASDNVINMTRRGYVLATRDGDAEQTIRRLGEGLSGGENALIRHHTDSPGRAYQRSDSADWNSAPDGVDVLDNPTLIHSVFPGFDREIRKIVHIRRGGDISAQQLGEFMLLWFRENGGVRLTGDVTGVTCAQDFTVDVNTGEGMQKIVAGCLINAAGPYLQNIAAMLDIELPVFNVFQQKLAFEDKESAIPRSQPFAIDLDGQFIDWTDEERELLQSDGELSWLTHSMPGAIHCRPDGGETGRWVKLGWAYNAQTSQPSAVLPLDPHFPEIVLRGAARLNPALRDYYGRLPRARHHYGGWYTMTEENWPLIGPMGYAGAFINGAHSGFGSMMACAAGELCAAWVAGAPLPTYSSKFSIDRVLDPALMTGLRSADKGIL